MQDTNLLQNPITVKLMNEAAREDIDKLLQGSTPQTYDAFIEENKMGMAPPVGLSLIHISEPTRPY